MHLWRVLSPEAAAKLDSSSQLADDILLTRSQLCRRNSPSPTLQLTHWLDSHVQCARWAHQTAWNCSIHHRAHHTLSLRIWAFVSPPHTSSKMVIVGYAPGSNLPPQAATCWLSWKKLHFQRAHHRNRAQHFFVWRRSGCLQCQYRIFYVVG